MSDCERKYLIWSIEHNAWWAPNWNGYTAKRGNAGIYSEAEAFEISDRENEGTNEPYEALVPIWQVKERGDD